MTREDPFPAGPTRDRDGTAAAESERARERAWRRRRRRRRGGVTSDERGVTETLGFVFAFSLIVTTVAIVYVVGIGGLQDVRDFEQTNNAERAFDVLADNFRDVARRGAPSRATEVKLAGATLRLGDPVTFNVTVENSTGRALSPPPYDVRPIVYETTRQSAVVFTAGAVLRTSRGGSVMLQPPGFLLDTESVVLPLLKTQAREASAVGGETTVLVRGERVSESVVVDAESEQYDVFLTISGTERAAAWQRTLDARSGVSCSMVSATEAECQVTDAARVSMSVTRVAVYFAS